MVADRKTETIKCMGPDPKSAHPLVYLATKDNKAQCPYCGKTYKVKADSLSQQKEEKPVKF